MNNSIETTSIYINEKEITMSKMLYFGLKRFFDIISSLIGLVLLIPFIFIIKISYLLSGDTASIFYSHNRIGKNGKIFKLYKFRSMVHNADEVLKEMLKDKELKNEWDKNQKFKNDKRLTKIGKLIRKASIDEMPQFINILKGDMSLIGPRPLVIGELDKHNGNHELYESVRPGITGWWASNGRSETSYNERLQLEYFYINNMSLLLDIKCMFKTIGAVLFKKGAR